MVDRAGRDRCCAQPWVPQPPGALRGGARRAGRAGDRGFLLATREGYLTVAAVLASLYPAFTVILAATVLREHVHRSQAVGLVLCAVAVALVAAGGSRGQRRPPVSTSTSATLT